MKGCAFIPHYFNGGSRQMDTTINARAGFSGTLRSALRANGIFSAVSSTLLIVLAQPLSTLTGIRPPVILVIVGLLVLPFAALLLWATSRPTMVRRLAVATIVLDVIWVMASIGILLSGWLLTTTGKWLIGILALIVADFAIWQSIRLKRVS
jgi:hypothetical protein